MTAQEKAKARAEKDLGWFDRLPPAWRELYVRLDEYLDPSEISRARKKFNDDARAAEPYLQQRRDALRKFLVIKSYGLEHPLVARGGGGEGQGRPGDPADRRRVRRHAGDRRAADGDDPMRHYVAVQDAEGRWFYANEGIHRTTGLPGWAPSGACARDCPGHETEEAAYEHEKERLLSEATRFEADNPKASTLRRCQAPGCEAFTSGYGTVGAYRMFDLCAEHRTKETLGHLLSVGESWES